MNRTAFITGANRGLGLELVRQLINEGYLIYAGCRKPKEATALNQLLPSERIILLDVNNPTSIDEAGSYLSANINKLDLLINNAGVGESDDSSLSTVNATAMANTFNTNVIGPLLVVKVLSGILKAGSKIINISSLMGSVADNTSGGYYSYRTSKAGLNMVSRNLSIELRSRDIAVINMHPGWVRTDMGGTNAPLSVDESIAGLLEVIFNCGLEESGKFLNWKGDELDW